MLSLLLLYTCSKGYEEFRFLRSVLSSRRKEGEMPSIETIRSHSVRVVFGTPQKGVPGKFDPTKTAQERYQAKQLRRGNQRPEVDAEQLKLWELVKGITLAVAEVEKWLDRLEAGELVNEQAGATGALFLPQEVEERRKKLSEVLVWAILQIPSQQLFDTLSKGRGQTIRSDASARGLLEFKRKAHEKKFASAEGAEQEKAREWLDMETLFSSALFNEFLQGWCPSRSLSMHPFFRQL